MIIDASGRNLNFDKANKINKYLETLDSFSLQIRNRQASGNALTANVFDKLTRSTGIYYDGYEGKSFVPEQVNGLQLPNNNVRDISYNSSLNILYFKNDEGIWIYDIDTDTGSIIDTDTVVNGDALRYNTGNAIAFDNNNQIIYTSFGTTVNDNKGIWIYDISTNTGSIIDQSTSVTGDSLLDGVIQSLYYDGINGYLYVGLDDNGLPGSGGLWQYNIATDTGKRFTPSGGAGNGDQLPNEVVNSVFMDEARNVLYVGTRDGGLWQYNIGTDTGKIFNTSGGAGNGEQLNNNKADSIYYDTTNDILWVGTGNGLWQYNIATDTGKRFTSTGGAGSGDQIPFNNVSGVFVDETNNILYCVTTSKGMWIYNITTDTGETIDKDYSITSGITYNNNSSTNVFKVSNDVYVSNLSGIWLYESDIDKGTIISVSGVFDNYNDSPPYDIILDIKKHISSNTIYVALDDNYGIWAYDFDTGLGKMFTSTGGAGSGDQLPVNLVKNISIDQTNNKVYCATATAGIWIYDIDTDTGSIINTSTSVTGDSLQSDSLTSIFINFNNILWVGTSSDGIWQHDIDTNTGKQFKESGGAGSGDQLLMDFVISIIGDNINDIVYVGCSNNGVWRYNKTTDTGYGFTPSGGAGNGDQFPDTGAQVNNMYFDTINRILYCATSPFGIWIYDTINDIGKIISTSLGDVNGQALPSNVCYAITVDETLKRLYVGTENGLWQYTPNNNYGKILNTASYGLSPPTGQINTLYFDQENRDLYSGTESDGIWYYELAITISESDYKEKIAEMTTKTLEIKHMRFLLSSESQLTNKYTFKKRATLGKGEDLIISLASYVDSNNASSLVVDVPFPNGLIVETENFFDYDINPDATVDIIIYHTKGLQTFVNNKIFEDSGKKPLPDITQFFPELIKLASERDEQAWKKRQLQPIDELLNIQPEEKKSNNWFYGILLALLAYLAFNKDKE